MHDVIVMAAILDFGPRQDQNTNSISSEHYWPIFLKLCNYAEQHALTIVSRHFINICYASWDTGVLKCHVQI